MNNALSVVKHFHYFNRTLGVVLDEAIGARTILANNACLEKTD